MQSVSFSIPKLIGFVSRSLESCVRLTDGWGVSALVKSIEVHVLYVYEGCCIGSYLCLHNGVITCIVLYSVVYDFMYV